ncbi:MAG: sulfur carrier protein ThiS [bacterium]
MKMSIFINGKKEELEEGTRISHLLEKKNIRPEVVTVELNNAVIKREEYSRTVLKDQDQLEFVYFMGGG